MRLHVRVFVEPPRGRAARGEEIRRVDHRQRNEQDHGFGDAEELRGFLAQPKAEKKRGAHRRGRPAGAPAQRPAAAEAAPGAEERGLGSKNTRTTITWLMAAIPSDAAPSSCRHSQSSDHCDAARHLVFKHKVGRVADSSNQHTTK